MNSQSAGLVRPVESKGLEVGNCSLPHANNPLAAAMGQNARFLTDIQKEKSTDKHVYIQTDMYIHTKR